MQRVVDNGTSITIEEETRSADVVITGISGENAITVVSVGKDKKMTANTTFFTGITWMDVCTGTYYTTVLPPIMGIPAQLPNKKLQVADVNPNMYRIVDLYKPGYSLKFTKIENSGVDEGGKFNMIREEWQPIGLNYGQFGLYIHDIGYWQGDDSFVLAGGFHGGMYEDNRIFFYHVYCIDDGRYLDYNKEYFIPNAE